MDIAVSIVLLLYQWFILSNGLDYEKEEEQREFHRLLCTKKPQLHECNQFNQDNKDRRRRKPTKNVHSFTTNETKPEGATIKMTNDLLTTGDKLLAELGGVILQTMGIGGDGNNDKGNGNGIATVINGPSLTGVGLGGVINRIADQLLSSLNPPSKLKEPLERPYSVRSPLSDDELNNRLGIRLDLDLNNTVSQQYLNNTVSRYPTRSQPYRINNTVSSRKKSPAKSTSTALDLLKSRLKSFNATDQAINDHSKVPKNPFESIAVRNNNDSQLITIGVADGDRRGISDGRSDEHVNEPIPNKLKLRQSEMNELCEQFAQFAADKCLSTKQKPPVELEAKCIGFRRDCAHWIQTNRPLASLANAYNSGVGITLYNVDVNGIPYYPINTEGAVGVGQHAKIDFGTAGGGYSDTFGVRDFVSLTREFGGNWYEGLYGYKTGFSIPLVQSLGVEGGGGTMVSVPIKEGDLGKPISATTGFGVGPYFSTADRTSVDWYNGGLSQTLGFAIPLLGVNIASGTNVGFPSISALTGPLPVG